MRKVPVYHYLFLFIACICIKSHVYAVPAYPHKVKVTTSNQKKVEIFLYGDENTKYARTIDGYTLLNDSDGWWYAKKSENGGLIKSEFRLMDKNDETELLKTFKETCPKQLHFDRQKTTEKMPTSAGQRRATPNAPIAGERRALVILMQYKNLPFQKTNSDFQSLFNEQDYHQDNATGSVRDFYRFASQGQLDYISDIYGPYTSKYNMSYYGGNASLGGDDAHALELCREAMTSLPKDIDFSIYDNDNDGLIDNVHIIFAGYGEEAGASADAIWSHEYPHRINLKTEIGYSLAGYSCSPELRSNRGNKISHIGVVCHELGHALGAMDYYDTNYGTGGEYLGTGQWDIMAGGSWNDDGRTPPNFNPYVRSQVFGWIRQELLTANQQVVMPCMNPEDAAQAIVYRLETESDKDYFLLENRQQHYFDSALPGAGLMVYHVHPNIETFSRTNTVNATHPQGLYPVCASYSEPSKKKYGNINSKECPFPGSNDTRVFSATSSPAAKAWDGSSAKVSLTNIKINSSDGSISFSTSKEEVIIDPEKPDTPTDKILLYKESFDSDISGSISIVSVAGKEKWRTYRKGNFVTNADLIPEATDGSSILMLFSGKDKAISESEADGPDIEVETGTRYFFTFDIFCESYANMPTPEFAVYIDNQLGEYNIYSFKDSTAIWHTIELPLVFADSLFCYKLYGKIQSGGIFIDNIRLYKEEVITSIPLTTLPVSSSVIYSLTGTRQSSLRRGINIIRGKDGRMCKIFKKNR